MADIVKLGKPDARGNFKRDLGWKPANGGFVQQRFYVGRDRAQAVERVLRLERLWAAVEADWNQNQWLLSRASAQAPDTPRPPWNLSTGEYKYQSPPPRPLWNVHILAVGMAIARGDSEIEIDPAADPGLKVTSPILLAEWFAWLSSLVAGCGVRLSLGSDPRKDVEDASKRHYAETVESSKKKVQSARKQYEAVSGQRVSDGQMLHKALDAFSDYLGGKSVNDDGAITPTGKRYQRQTKQIKESIEDMPLSAFGLHVIERLEYTWERRPISPKHKRPMAVETVRDVVKRIREFLRWLHRSAFNWRLPADYVPRRMSIKLTPAELAAKAQPHGRRTYTVDELCTLWEYASPWERLLMILALNCGFGQAEIATLQIDEISLDAPHGHYSISGNFIKRIRFKTGVYGEWMLWPETVQAIEWMKRRRGSNAETALIVTSRGQPLHKQTKGGSRNMRIPNTWKTLLQRVKKDFPNFRILSFNKLRKTASSFVRRKYDGEVAGIFLAHGRVVSDDLLERYADRDFCPVFKACRHWRKVLQRMFERVSDPFPVDGKKHNPSVTLATVKRMKELREQGRTIKEIAAEVGLHRATVRTYLDQHG